MLKVTIDKEFPLNSLDECNSQLRVMSVLFAGHDPDLGFEEDELAGNASILDLLTKALHQIGVAIHAKYHPDAQPASENTRAAAPHRAPKLTEPAPLGAVRAKRRAA